jgi:predicted nucleotidyltransferase
VNLAGVHVILSLLEQMEKLTGEVIRLRRDIDEGPKALGPGTIRRRRRTVRIEIQGPDEATPDTTSADQGVQLSEPALALKVVEMIRDGYDPEKIIIFGSHARGQASRHSDLDIMVIKDTDAGQFDRIREVSELVRPRPLPLDILVKTPEEIEHRLEIGDYFIREIMDEGVVAYERATA